VAIHAAEDGSRLAAVAVGHAPFGITVAADGAQAFVANVRSDSVSVLDLP
jgi:DNA-binding beta-propeller fold protein YncE